MLLQTDEQTIEDLGLFGDRNTGGIYEIYNTAHTRGGGEILKEMFRNPLSDKDAINQRSSIIQNFSLINPVFPFSATSFDMAEKYLINTNEQQKGNTHHATMLGEKEMHNGVSAIIDILWATKTFIEKKEVIGIMDFQSERKKIIKLLNDAVFEPALKGKSVSKLSYAAITAYDTLFRLRECDKIKMLLKHVYKLDVYISIAKIAIKRKFVFPTALEKGTGELKIAGVYHPELKKPVDNNIYINKGQNVIFLTGANMAGKSTFLRSVSTAVYLAHMGFPVAARSMVFSVMDGLYTTINLPDKLGIGASHFYVEVLRVRKIATELGQGKSLFIIFDELFRGTNVKDAHEATVAVTHAFAGKKTSMFIISSHIVETAEELRRNGNIDFQYLPTMMKDTTPQYTYKLKQGVTDDRHGMIIIRNEGILDILKNGIKNK